MLNYLHVLVSSTLARMNERLRIKESSNGRNDGHVHSGESHYLSEPCLLLLLNQILVDVSSSDSYLLGYRICAKKGFPVSVRFSHPV